MYIICKIVYLPIKNLGNATDNKEVEMLMKALTH